MIYELNLDFYFCKTNLYQTVCADPVISNHSLETDVLHSPLQQIFVHIHKQIQSQLMYFLIAWT